MHEVPHLFFSFFCPFGRPKHRVLSEFLQTVMYGFSRVMKQGSVDFLARGLGIVELGFFMNNAFEFE